MFCRWNKRLNIRWHFVNNTYIIQMLLQRYLKRYGWVIFNRRHISLHLYCRNPSYFLHRRENSSLKGIYNNNIICLKNVFWNTEIMRFMMINTYVHNLNTAHLNDEAYRNIEIKFHMKETIIIVKITILFVIKL